MNWDIVKVFAGFLFFFGLVGSCTYLMSTDEAYCQYAEADLRDLVPCYNDSECKLEPKELERLLNAEREAARICPIARGENWRPRHVRKSQ